MSLIIGVVGRRGGGKTTLLSSWAVRAAKARHNIRSNYLLRLPTFQPLYLPPSPLKDEQEQDYHERLRQHFGPMNDTLVLMSEAYRMALDSRRSGDGRAVAWSYWFSETRKRNTDVALDSQSIGKIDLRVRELLDYLVLAYSFSCEGCGADTRRRRGCTCRCRLTPACGLEWSAIMWLEPGLLKDDLEHVGTEAMLRTPAYRYFDSYEILSYAPTGGPKPGGLELDAAPVGSAARRLAEESLARRAQGKA